VSRFARRVLSNSEFAEYLRQDDRRQFLWLAWSAKESAYKYLKQRDVTTPFLPSKFEFCSDASSVTFSDQEIAVRHKTTEDFIYCRTGAEPISPALDAIARVTSAEEQQSQVRILAQGMLATKANGQAEAVLFGKNSAGVPFVTIGGRLAPISLSFTHHGRFVACTVR
jgi:phosphopantetheinyl transferase